MTSATFAIHLAIVSRYCGAVGLTDTVFGLTTNIGFASRGQMMAPRMSRLSTTTNRLSERS